MLSGLLLLATFSCVSSQAAAAGRVTDPTGRPIADAWVVFAYAGTNHRGLVHASSWRGSGGVLRSDAAGRIALDSRLLFTGPLVSEVEPKILAAYAPERRSGTVTPTSTGFDVVLPEVENGEEWLAGFQAFRDVVRRGCERGWLGGDAPRELHELIVREYERMLAAEGAYALGERDQRIVRQILDHYRSDPPR